MEVKNFFQQLRTNGFGVLLYFKNMCCQYFNNTKLSFSLIHTLFSQNCLRIYLNLAKTSLGLLKFIRASISCSYPMTNISSQLAHWTFNKKKMSLNVSNIFSLFQTRKCLFFLRRTLCNANTLFRSSIRLQKNYHILHI